MARTFTSTDLITLPRLSAAEALALLTALVSAAQPHAAQLPAPVGEALRELQSARTALQRARAQRRKVPTKAEPRKVREADTTLDRCWRALERWASALQLIPASYVAERPQLDALHASLFGGGMGFLNERFEVEWAESETRLDQIKREQMSTLIESLGGGVLLRAVRDAHHAYGEALGVTVAPAAAPVAAPDGEAFRQLFQDTQETLRRYAAEVAVLSHRRDPAQRELAAALLRPLTGWTSRPASASDEEDEESAEPDGEQPDGQPGG